MPEQLHRRLNLLIGLGLAAAVAVVFWPVRQFAFINYDDDVYVTANPEVQSGLTRRGLAWAFTTGHAGNWHPLTWLSHMLDCQLFGVNAGAQHLVNVLFHLANTLLLFGVLRRLTGALWRSALVAALFALHPLHVESVAWVAERKDVLSTLFWLLALWAYARYVQTPGVSHRKSEIGARFPDLCPRASAYYWLALGFFVCGLMSKAMVVTLPLVLLLLDYWPLNRVVGGRFQAASCDARPSTLWALVWEKAPFICLAAGSCGMTLWAQRRGGAVVSVESLPLGLRAANAVVAYARYLGHALWPTGLAVFYPYQAWSWVTVLGAGVLLAGVSGVVVWRGRRERPWLVGWLWYLATLLPVIGLVQVGGQSLADRYTYVPLIGVFIMVAWGLPKRMFERRIGRMAAAVLAAGVLCVCVVLSSLQVRYWRNSETLFRHALKVRTGNAQAHNNLGAALAARGLLAEAVTEYGAALLASPNYAKAHYNLGNALADQGKPAEAVLEYQAALRISPNYPEACNNLGTVLATQGKLAEAIAQYEAALRIRPAYANAHGNLGDALAAQGKLVEAVAEYEAALRLKPDFAEARYNLGGVLVAQGQTQEASAQYREVLRYRPDWPPALSRLAWLLATHKDPGVRNGAEAVRLAERLCQIAGQQQAEAMDVLAAAYAEAGRFNDAVGAAQTAVALATAAGQQDLARPIEERLKSYQAGHPYHE